MNRVLAHTYRRRFLDSARRLREGANDESVSPERRKAFRREAQWCRTVASVLREVSK